MWNSGTNFEKTGIFVNIAKNIGCFFEFFVIYCRCMYRQQQPIMPMSQIPIPAMRANQNAGTMKFPSKAVILDHKNKSDRLITLQGTVRSKNPVALPAAKLWLLTSYLKNWASAFCRICPGLYRRKRVENVKPDGLSPQ